MRNVLIIGGAGFIGSNVAEHMVEAGFSVTVIDGILPNTGASINNLAVTLSRITFIQSRVEDVSSLSEMLETMDVVIAAFGWTSHKNAFDQPLYDLELNLKAHIYLLEKIKVANRKPLLINLGSSVQFGKAENSKLIDEDAQQFALDVQGVHKIAAESYYRIYALIYGINVYSLRIPNCFGPGQKTSGDDIGLIGTFVLDALANREIMVFGSGRKRSILYVSDLATIIVRIINKPPNGFVPLNVPAHHIEINELARLIIKEAGTGTLVIKEMPSLIGKIDFAGTMFDTSSFNYIISDFILKSLEESIKSTINYFKGFIHE